MYSDASEEHAVFKSLKVFYHDINYVKKDIDLILGRYPKMRIVQTVSYTSNTIVIGVTGPLPIIYNARTFGIPLLIAFTYQYPISPPEISCVKGPDTEIVRGHPIVHESGQVYNIANNWALASSNILRFLGDLSLAFGANPPMRKVSANQYAQIYMGQQSMPQTFYSPMPSQGSFYAVRNPYQVGYQPTEQVYYEPQRGMQQQYRIPAPVSQPQQIYTAVQAPSVPRTPNIPKNIYLKQTNPEEELKRKQTEKENIEQKMKQIKEQQDVDELMTAIKRENRVIEQTTQWLNSNKIPEGTPKELALSSLDPKTRERNEKESELLAVDECLGILSECVRNKSCTLDEAIEHIQVLSARKYKAKHVIYELQ